MSSVIHLPRRNDDTIDQWLLAHPSPDEERVLATLQYIGAPPFVRGYRVRTRGGAYRLEIAWPERLQAVEMMDPVVLGPHCDLADDERASAEIARLILLADYGWRVRPIAHSELGDDDHLIGLLQAFLAER